MIFIISNQLFQHFIEIFLSWLESFFRFTLQKAAEKYVLKWGYLFFFLNFFFFFLKVNLILFMTMYMWFLKSNVFFFFLIEFNGWRHFNHNINILNKLHFVHYKETFNTDWHACSIKHAGLIKHWLWIWFLWDVLNMADCQIQFISEKKKIFQTEFQP